MHYKGSSNSAAEVEYWDRDEDGSLDSLARRDRFALREEISRRIDALIAESSFRPATPEEIRQKINQLSGKPIEVVCKERLIRGFVVGVEVESSRDAVLRIVENSKSAQCGPRANVVQVRCDRIFDVLVEAN